MQIVTVDIKKLEHIIIEYGAYESREFEQIDDKAVIKFKKIKPEVPLSKINSIMED
ncbi:hypothetical protein [Bacillus sp. 03113]|uniref:hypothetical protein n=1 Tax=Bacillus sp. 03113 TaxID=2578211 RepID=UPI001C657C48|nr:hypothetical protein [Bacillus sp. 03113]